MISNFSRRLGWLVLVFCLAVGGVPVALASSEEPIQIGVTLGLSGQYATVALDQKRAFRLWVEQTNARGGLLGRQVRLTVLDDHGDPQRARELYRKLIEQEGKDLLLAPFSSEITGAVLPLFERHRFPLLASGAAADELWQRGSEYIFGMFTVASKIPSAFLDMLLLHGVDRLALLHAADPFCRSAAAGVRRRANWLGLELRLDKTFDSDRVDFDALLARVKESESRVLILAGRLEEAVALRRAMAVADWAPQVYYAVQGPANPEFARRLGAAADEVFGTEQWQHLGGLITPESEAFLAAYREKYGAEASYFSVTAYSAARILAHAVQEVDSLDGEQLREVLANLDMLCLTGRFRVDARGRQIRNFTLVTQWQQGRLEVVWPRELKTAEPQL